MPCWALNLGCFSCTFVPRAVKRQSPTIRIADSMSAFMRQLGLGARGREGDHRALQGPALLPGRLPHSPDDSASYGALAGAGAGCAFGAGSRGFEYGGAFVVEPRFGAAPPKIT